MSVHFFTAFVHSSCTSRSEYYTTSTVNNHYIVCFQWYIILYTTSETLHCLWEVKVVGNTELLSIIARPYRAQEDDHWYSLCYKLVVSFWLDIFLDQHGHRTNCSRSCNDCQISILKCTYKSSVVYEMDRDDTIENYHDFSVIFAIALMELFSK